MVRKESEAGRIEIEPKAFSETFIKNYDKNKEVFQEETESLLTVPEKRLSLIIS